MEQRTMHTNHAPAPWGCTNLGEPGYGMPRTIYHEETGKTIASVAGQYGGPCEWEAHARLMTASPLLLAALVRLLASSRMYRRNKPVSRHYQSCLEQAQTAIDLALGTVIR